MILFTNLYWIPNKLLLMSTEKRYSLIVKAKQSIYLQGVPKQANQNEFVATISPPYKYKLSLQVEYMKQKRNSRKIKKKQQKT